jgi:hypothetical protein
MFIGRIRINGTTTVETVVIWILGLAGFEVKRKRSLNQNMRKPLIKNGL